MCESFNIQYKTNFIAVMPTNLYGPGDNFNLEKSHVLPAILRKIHLGKCLEEGNWAGLRKDLNKNPIEGINGDSEEKKILDTLNKFGVAIADEDTKRESRNSRQLNMKISGRVSVNLWGTGTPLREFMYSLDMAEACVFVMENVDIADILKLNHSLEPEYHSPHFINIGTGEEVSIKELALRIKNMTGFKGEIVFDPAKPDGTMRKITDVSRLHKLGFRHNLDLVTGLAETYAYYLK
jgi:GDP-L-fucose synthase